MAKKKSPKSEDDATPGGLKTGRKVSAPEASAAEAAKKALKKKQLKAAEKEEKKAGKKAERKEAKQAKKAEKKAAKAGKAEKSGKKSGAKRTVETVMTEKRAAVPQAAATAKKASDARKKAETGKAKSGAAEKKAAKEPAKKANAAPEKKKTAAKKTSKIEPAAKSLKSPAEPPQKKSKPAAASAKKPAAPSKATPRAAAKQSASAPASLPAATRRALKKPVKAAAAPAPAPSRAASRQAVGKTAPRKTNPPKSMPPRPSAPPAPEPSEAFASAPLPPEIEPGAAAALKSGLATPPAKTAGQTAQGSTRLVLLARDPDWLYAYWDISGADRESHRIGDRFGAPLIFMRMHALEHDGSPAANGSFDLMIMPEAENWLIQTPRIDRDWRAEMGYIGHDGQFVTIAVSNRLSSPYTEPAPQPQETLPQAGDDAAINETLQAPLEPVELPAFERLGRPFELDWGLPEGPEANEDGGRHPRHEAMLESPASPVLPEDYAPAPYPQLEPQTPPWNVIAESHPFFAEGEPQPAPADHSNAALEPLGSSEQLARPAAEAPALEEAPSAGASELMARQPGVPSQAASQPFGAPPEKEGGKDFWLWVKTEVIVYGATEPDAKVTLQGLPLELRPDGTFSVRFALPEGEHFYPVRAVNRDGDMERQITPVVTRRTEK